MTTDRHTMRAPLQRRTAGGLQRRTAGGPFRDVVWIGVSPPGPQGGKAWTFVLSCGHIAQRRYPQPQPHSIFRKMPTAPHKCRCLSCELGTVHADPQGWIDILTARGYSP